MAEFGDETHSWPAYVHRADGAIDSSTRTIDVVVRVANPYRPDGGDTPPLLVGTFAEVEIEARTAAEYVTIPREALREGDVVWVVNDEHLQIVEVAVVQEVENEVILRDGIEAGTRVVVSPLAVMTDGMTVRLAE